MGLTRSKITRSSLRRDGVAVATTPEPPVVAAWTSSLVRYFFVSYDTGVDTNTGYIDAAAGTVFAAGVGDAIAVKTFSRLMKIVPLIGNGRTMVVLIKNRAAGATYLDDDGTTQSVVNWSSLSGYQTIVRRGSTDLTNSVTDRIRCGFISAQTGPNGDGSFTCLAGATTTTFSVTGTPFAAEPGAIGYRVRFTGNVTAGLANVCTSVQINTSSQITSSTVITAPAAGDTFFLEITGVAVAKWIDQSWGEARTTPITVTFSRAAIRDVGIMAKAAVESSLAFGGAPREISGCAQDSTAAANVFRLADCDLAAISAGYSDETDTTRTVGIGLRLGATIFSINRVRELNADVFVHARNTATQPLVDRVQYGNVFTAAYLGSGIVLRASGHPSPGSGNGFIYGSGSGGGTNKTRQIGPCTLSSFAGVIRGIDVVNSAGAGFIASNFGLVNATISFDNLSGTSSTFGVDFSGAGCRLSKFVFGVVAANTITGTSGDLRAPANNAILTHTGLTRTNVIDSQGNEWLGTAGRLVTGCAPISNQSGGALAIGDVIRGNGTTGQCTSAQGDTLANSPVLGIMVTAPASGAAGYFCPPGCGSPSLNFTANPTAGAIAYLSTTNARQATTTEPVITGTLQKVKLGRVINFVTTTGQITFEPDSKPENTIDTAPIAAEISNAAAAFSATQTWLIATGTYTANRAFTLEAISTLGTNVRRTISDLTVGGAFNIVITPNAADAIDGAAAGATLSIPCGSKQTITLRSTPTSGWKIV